MKREKQKCHVLFCFVVYAIILTDNASIVQGFSKINLENSTHFNLNNHERSANIFSTINTNGQQQNNQYLNQYFKKVMEPIRNMTDGERQHTLFTSTVNSTEPYYRTRMNDLNTQPNFIYPSLHSTPYAPMVVTERYHPQNHLTQKKDSADSSKLKISSRSDKTNFVDKFPRPNSDVFKPRIIPVEPADSAFGSRSFSEESFQPFIPAEAESRAIKTHRISAKRKDTIQKKTTKEAATTSRPSVQPSTQPSRKNVPEVRISPNSKLIEESRSKIKKKYRKYMLPLLLAYKLKFFTLIPLMMGGLVLLTGATGMAGFFFALFASVIGLRVGNPPN